MNINQSPALYAIYLRKSRDEDEQDRYTGEDTLARHRKTLVELAARLSLPVGEIYEEVVSGDTIASRPEMQRLLADVRAGRWAGVLVTETPRLARGDTIDQGVVSATFKYAKCRIVTPAKIYDPALQTDEQQIDMQLFFSRWELHAITARMQAGRKRSAQDGRYMGSCDVFGYKRVRLEGQKGFTVEIKPAEAEIVKLIFAWYVYGDNGAPLGCTEIARRVNAMGVKTSGGSPWLDTSIRRLLKNELYVGCVCWQRRMQEKYMDGARVKKRNVQNPENHTYPGLHQPIVDRELFDAAARKLTSRITAPLNVGRDLTNPLSGLIVCAVCGKYLRRTVSASGGEKSIVRCGTDCKTSGIYIAVLESLILSALAGYAAAPDPAESPAAQPPSDDTDARMIAIAEREIERLTSQMSRACEFYETGEYTKELFLRRQHEITAAITKAQAQLDQIKNKQPTQKTDEEILRALSPKIKTVLQAYAAAKTPAEKNALLKSILAHITYHKTKRRKKTDPPAAHLTITLHPKSI